MPSPIKVGGIPKRPLRAIGLQFGLQIGACISPVAKACCARDSEAFRGVVDGQSRKQPKPCQFGGGIRTSVSPTLDLHAEGWYGIVSDVNQFSLRVGMSYRLGL